MDTQEESFAQLQEVNTLEGKELERVFKEEFNK